MRRARRTGPASASRPSGSNSGATRDHRLHERRLFSRAGRTGVDQHAALSMSGAQDIARDAERARLDAQRRARLDGDDAVPRRGSRAGRWRRPARPRCSAASPTLRSTSSPASATLVGVWVAAQPADEDPPLRPRQGRGARGDLPGDPDRALGRRHRFPRGAAAGRRRAGRGGGPGDRRLAGGDRRDVRAARLAAARDPPAPARWRSAPTTSTTSRTCCSTSR